MEKIICPKCATRYRVAPEAFGRMAKCKKCGVSFIVQPIDDVTPSPTASPLPPQPTTPPSQPTDETARPKSKFVSRTLEVLSILAFLIAVVLWMRWSPLKEISMPSMPNNLSDLWNRPTTRNERSDEQIVGDILGLEPVQPWSQYCRRGLISRYGIILWIELPRTGDESMRTDEGDVAGVIVSGIPGLLAGSACFAGLGAMLALASLILGFRNRRLLPSGRLSQSDWLVPMACISIIGITMVSVCLRESARRKLEIGNYRDAKIFSDVIVTALRRFVDQRKGFPESIDEVENMAREGAAWSYIQPSRIPTGQKLSDWFDYHKPSFLPNEKHKELASILIYPRWARTLDDRTPVVCLVSRPQGQNWRVNWVPMVVRSVDIESALQRQEKGG